MQSSTLLLNSENKPRICHIQPYTSTLGHAAIDLCSLAGLQLDEWQQFILINSLGTNQDGTWAARQVGLCISRQNGKTILLEARALVSLFVLQEPLCVHTAHQSDTAKEQFLRIKTRIENCPELKSRVQSIKGGHGNEEIKLLRNERGIEPRLTFRTRTGAGGLGFSVNTLIFDEAMIIPDEIQGALLPTQSAVANPQTWYCGSSVDKEFTEDGLAFARVREAGMRKDHSVAYFEYSAAGCDDPNRADKIADSEQAWKEANPGYGIRITKETIETEHKAMNPRMFAIYRLGVGDWPAGDGSSQLVITPDQWRECLDETSAIEGNKVCFAIDVTPERSHACISVSGRRSDGKLHVEVIDHQAGLGWVADRAADLAKRYPKAKIIIEQQLAGSIFSDLNDKRVRFEAVAAKEHGQACATFIDAIHEGNLFHRDQEILLESLKGAKKRSLGEAWAWDRKNTSFDISPLVSATLAVWGASQIKRSSPQVIDTNMMIEQMRANGEI